MSLYKGGRCVRLTPLPPSCAVVIISGNLNFLESSGPLQVCNGTALLLPFNKRDSFSLNRLHLLICVFDVALFRRHLICILLIYFLFLCNCVAFFVMCLYVMLFRYWPLGSWLSALLKGIGLFYSCFWAIRLPLNFMCRRFGTTCLFYLQRLFTRSMKMEQTGCFEPSAHKIQRPRNHPKERIQHSEHGESLESKFELVWTELLLHIIGFLV
jgi:hypothetical protein